MKYFTKEWYELCQNTTADLLLEEEKEAESFSEEYFQQLSEDEMYILRASYQKEREVAKERYISPEPFDREKGSKRFE